MFSVVEICLISPSFPRHRVGFCLSRFYKFIQLSAFWMAYPCCPYHLFFLLQKSFYQNSFFVLRYFVFFNFPLFFCCYLYFFHNSVMFSDEYGIWNGIPRWFFRYLSIWAVRQFPSLPPSPPLLPPPPSPSSLRQFLVIRLLMITVFIPQTWKEVVRNFTRCTNCATWRMSNDCHMTTHVV